MKFTKTQVATAAACSVMLVGTGAALAAPQVVAAPQGVAGVVQSCGECTAGIVGVSSVEGSFAFTQDSITPTGKISEAFVKSAARLCTVTSAALAASGQVSVSDDNGSMTMAQAAAAVEEGTYILACACSSNLAGGGIVANAQVKGVPVSQLVAAL